MTTTYEPPLTGSSPDRRILREAIGEGPTYVRTWIAEWAPDELRESYTAWCGQLIFGGRDPWFTDTPPADEPLCGPCEGRAIGADPNRPEWLFLPRRLRRPKVCPGSQTRWYTETAWNRGICLVCGDAVKLRGYGGAYRWDFGAQRHSPGEQLVDPCQFHGWKQLTLRTATVVCRCEVTD